MTTIGPEHYGCLGRVGNAIYVTLIALAILAFALSVSGSLGKADMVMNLTFAALVSLALWGAGWVIRWALGGGPAK